jgi:hypothetical protein
VLDDLARERFANARQSGEFFGGGGVEVDTRLA